MPQKIMILGASGMLGSALLRFFSTEVSGFEVHATVRSTAAARILQVVPPHRLIANIDVTNPDSLIGALACTQPDVVVNCVGVVKQHETAGDPLTVLPINAMLPHRLSRLCAAMSARLIHVSTDCVFDGRDGNYVEDDVPTATDLYGQSKYIGEVRGPNAITLRTSIIGHELSGAHGLVNWFLSQVGEIRGFKNAIFSGVPTVELARVIHEFVLPKPELSGLYHLAAKPISKFDLLNLVASIYGKDIVIAPDESVRIDRSLNGSRFSTATGYIPPDWPDLISQMHAFQREH